MGLTVLPKHLVLHMAALQQAVTALLAEPSYQAGTIVTNPSISHISLSQGSNRMVTDSNWVSGHAKNLTYSLISVL